ncbi:MAG: lipoyl synthase, partial [Nitrososphaerota archaeon]
MQNIRKPEWIRTRMPSGEEYVRVRAILKRYKLNTVCEDALCPNLSNCWGSGTVTIMILGNICSRACRFCAVRSGDPGGKIDLDEPRRVGLA